MITFILNHSSHSLFFLTVWVLNPGFWEAWYNAQRIWQYIWLSKWYSFSWFVWFVFVLRWCFSSQRGLIAAYSNTQLYIVDNNQLDHSKIVQTYIFIYIPTYMYFPWLNDLTSHTGNVISKIFTKRRDIHFFW